MNLAQANGKHLEALSHMTLCASLPLAITGLYIYIFVVPSPQNSPDAAFEKIRPHVFHYVRSIMSPSLCLTVLQGLCEA